MHGSAYRLMESMLATIEGDLLQVLDVGSLDVNGTYKPIVQARGWGYMGLDIEPGPNVDILAADPLSYPLESGSIDVIISGSTMEHVTAIWQWIPELTRILKPGGHLAIVTHWRYPEHKYPLDCWRVMPDGMRYLFDMTGQLEMYTIATNETDIAAMARKKRHD